MEKKNGSVVRSPAWTGNWRRYRRKMKSWGNTKSAWRNTFSELINEVTLLGTSDLANSQSTSTLDQADSHSTSTPLVTPRRETMDEIRSSGISPKTLLKPIRKKLLASSGIKVCSRLSVPTKTNSDATPIGITLKRAMARADAMASVVL